MEPTIKPVTYSRNAMESIAPLRFAIKAERPVTPAALAHKKIRGVYPTPRITRTFHQAGVAIAFAFAFVTR
jgi:hypothetical protein